MPATNNYLGLDVGTVRIGVALNVAGLSIVKPAGVITNDAQADQAIADLVQEHAITTIVVGLPRGLDGQETQQTALVRQFVDTLQPVVSVPIVLQDEALTSVQAEAALQQTGKDHQKGDIDALAATYILQDYIEEQANQLAHKSSGDEHDN